LWWIAIVFAGIDRILAQLLLNAQDSIVFGQTLGTARGTSFDLQMSVGLFSFSYSKLIPYPRFKFVKVKEDCNLILITCPVANPTTKSAMNVSSVSPERCETITPQPFFRANVAASIDSVTVPIWLTLIEH
jgi:hypothetical protein